MIFKELSAPFLAGPNFKKLSEYVRTVDEDNQSYNLTGFNVEQLWEFGIYQSLVAYQGMFPEGATVIDVGSGAGFPAIPILLANPTIKLTILEPQRKRVFFLEKIRHLLGLKFDIIQERAEDVKNKKADFITARAVMSLQQLMEATIHLGNVGSKYLFLKGPKAEQEIAEAKGTAEFFKLYPIVKEFESRSQHAIRLVEYTKTTNQPVGYPRAWIKIKTKPL